MYAERKDRQSFRGESHLQKHNYQKSHDIEIRDALLPPPLLPVCPRLPPCPSLSLTRACLSPPPFPLFFPPLPSPPPRKKQKQGLFNPENDRDACGVGFVGELDKAPTRQNVTQALKMLVRMSHRGGAVQLSNAADP